MKIRRLLVILGSVGLVVKTQAQLPVDGIHYPVGLEGIKGGSLPMPGIYFRDDNLFYTGTSPDLLGLSSDIRTSVYLQAPQLTWMTDYKILGVNYGMDVMVPYIYKKVSKKVINTTTIVTLPGGRVGVVSESRTEGGIRSGLGDVKFEPLLLSWHLEKFDFMAGYALWLPTGDYERSSPVNLGNGRWAHMLTLGGVWYPDEEKLWAFSVVNRFEFNSQVLGTSSVTTVIPGGRRITSSFSDDLNCSAYSLEWGISRTIFKTSDLGITGYFQEQFIDNSDKVTVIAILPGGRVNISSASLQSNDSRVAGIGPEIRTQISRWGLSASLRYAYEFLADNRPQGHTLNLTLTKWF